MRPHEAQLDGRLDRDAPCRSVAGPHRAHAYAREGDERGTREVGGSAEQKDEGRSEAEKQRTGWGTDDVGRHDLPGRHATVGHLEPFGLDEARYRRLRKRCVRRRCGADDRLGRPPPR